MNGLGSIFRTVLESLRFGADDPRLAIISFALVAAFVGLLVVIGFLIQAMWRDRGDRRSSGLPVRDARGTIIGTVVVVVAVGLLVGLADRYLTRPEVCGSCHPAQYDSAFGSTHESVRCVSCHRQPGALGFVLGQIDYVRWAYVEVSQRGPKASDPLPPQAAIANRSCVNCHRAVVSEMVYDDVIRVRHEDFLERPCTECHNAVGHGDSVGIPAQVAMNVCLNCHDARQLSAECALCHEGDVARAAQRSSPRAGPIKVAAPTGTNCRGCHEADTCDECHGTEMPHQPGWMPGHARPAFEQPNMCWRCHPSGELRNAGPPPYAMCNQCHRFPGPHGPTSEWVVRHGAAAAKAPGVFGRTRCSLCHTNERFCDLCHEGRREKVDYE